MKKNIYGDYWRLPNSPNCSKKLNASKVFFLVHLGRISSLQQDKTYTFLPNTKVDAKVVNRLIYYGREGWKKRKKIEAADASKLCN